MPDLGNSCYGKKAGRGVRNLRTRSRYNATIVETPDPPFEQLERSTQHEVKRINLSYDIGKTPVYKKMLPSGLGGLSGLPLKVVQFNQNRKKKKQVDVKPTRVSTFLEEGEFEPGSAIHLEAALLLAGMTAETAEFLAREKMVKEGGGTSEAGGRGRRPERRDVLPWVGLHFGWDIRPRSAVGNHRVTLTWGGETPASQAELEEMQQQERSRLAGRDRRTPYSWQEDHAPQAHPLGANDGGGGGHHHSLRPHTQQGISILASPRVLTPCSRPQTFTPTLNSRRSPSHGGPMGLAPLLSPNKSSRVGDSHNTPGSPSQGDDFKYTMDLMVLDKELWARQKSSVKVLIARRAESSPFVGDCDFCKTNTTLFICDKCKNAAYCGVNCQGAAWDDHRRNCGIQGAVLDIMGMLDTANLEFERAVGTRNRSINSQMFRSVFNCYKMTLSEISRKMNNCMYESTSQSINEKDWILRYIAGKCYCGLALAQLHLGVFARARKYVQQAYDIAFNLDDVVGQEVCTVLMNYLQPERLEKLREKT